MHDNYVVSYSVNIKEKTLVIFTYNDVNMREEKIVFQDVLTHSFKCILEINQVLDVDEYDVECFIHDNKDELNELAGDCWPIHYKDLEDLRGFLVDNGYKYIKLFASYGMSGWVLAKSYQID